MYIAEKECKSLYTTLTNYVKTLNDNTDIVSAKVKLYDNTLRTIKVLEEIEEVFDMNVLSQSNQLKLIAKNYKNINDIIEVKTYIELLIDTLEKLQTMSFHLKSKYLHFYQDEYALSYEDLSAIFNKIKLNNIKRQINIFDSNARYGETLNRIKHIVGIENKTYGVINDVVPNKDAIDRYIKNDVTKCRITNNVFDITICSTDIIFRENNNTLKEKTEKVILRDSLKYVRDNGIFIYIIPYFRLDKSIMTLLSKNLYNIRAFKCTDSSDINIIIIGNKNYTKEIKLDEYNYLKDLCFSSILNIGTSKDIAIEYSLPNNEKEVTLFKGNMFDENDIINMIHSDNLYNEFFNEQNKVEKLEDSSPLKPFNLGQIGLLLTSGVLDGVIEEADGIYHVIKGRAIKDKIVDNSIPTEKVETIGNKVEINVFTANGKFISLT